MNRKELIKTFNYTCAICDDFIGENGQCAHIISVSKKKKGPRHYTTIYKTLDHLSAKIVFDNNRNMLYLCYSCHKTIDTNSENYPIDTLNIYRSLCLLKCKDTQDIEESRKYNEKKDYAKKRAIKLKMDVEYGNNEIKNGNICFLIDFNNIELTFYDWIEIIEIILPYFSKTKDDIRHKLYPICSSFGIHYSQRKIYEKRFISELIKIIKSRFESGINKSTKIIKELTIYPKIYVLVSEKYKKQIKDNLKHLNDNVPSEHFKIVNTYIDYYLECCDVDYDKSNDCVIKWDSINNKYKKLNKTFAFDLDKMVTGEITIKTGNINKSKKEIKEDIKIDPQLVEILKCPDCDYSTEYKGSMTRHSNSENHGTKEDLKIDPQLVEILECPDCDYSTEYKGSMTRHSNSENHGTKKEIIYNTLKVEEKVCIYIFKLGDRKGERCNIKPRNKSNFCSAHKKYENNIPKVKVTTPKVKVNKSKENKSKCVYTFLSGDRCITTPRGISIFCSAHKKYDNTNPSSKYINECVHRFLSGDRKGEKCNITPRDKSNFCSAHRKYEL